MQAPAACPKQRGTPVIVLRQQVWPFGQQQLCVAPCPPHTSPGGWQPGGFWQRRSPSESALPQMNEQQSVLVLQISPSVPQPLRVRQTPDPIPLYSHRFEQQLREPLTEQGSPLGWQEPSVSQRWTLVSQWL